MAVFDPHTKGSPAWWVKTLSDRLNSQALRLEELERYDVGRHELKGVGAAGKEAWERFRDRSRANYIGLINESVREKMRIFGFRTAADRDENGDQEADKLYRINGLKVGANLLHHDVVSLGEGYAMVVPDAKLGARISVQSPFNTIVATDPTDRRVTIAGLTRWVGIDDRIHAVLHLGDKLYYAAGAIVQPTPFTNERAVMALPGSWEWEATPARNPLGRPAIVRFTNRPRTKRVQTPRGFWTDTLAEAEELLDSQDRINGEIFDRLTISAAQAFRQRWLKLGDANVDVKKLQEALNADPGAVWALQGDVEFGDFSTTDLRQILQAEGDDIKTLSALSRTPPHYLLGGMVNIGAEALHAAKDGFAGKVRDRCASVGEGWAEVFGMAFELTGLKDRSDPSDIEVIWEPVDPPTLSEKADAMVKLSNVLPLASNLREIGQFGPAAIERIMQERDQEDFDNAVRQVLNGGTDEEPTGSVGGTESATPADSRDPSRERTSSARPATEES